MVKRFSILTPGKHHALPDLGERELAVLEVLWERGDATAQAVQQQMTDAGISLSTVQSTLERLHRKGLLARNKQGRAYCYRALLDRSQLISGLLRDMAEQVAAGDLAPMISGFLDFVSSQAPELAGDLSRSFSARKPAQSADEAGDD
ncbi:MAG: hypothetical protein CSA53_03545 [Gammaproteobacteria bacterium]|nr:MAG: hypothetical protein CSA53_03545 [Gammaproteobacteria bacterium]